MCKRQVLLVFTEVKLHFVTILLSLFIFSRRFVHDSSSKLKRLVFILAAVTSRAPTCVSVGNLLGPFSRQCCSWPETHDIIPDDWLMVGSFCAEDVTHKQRFSQQRFAAQGGINSSNLVQ